MAVSLFFAADLEAVRRISLDEQQRVHTFAVLTSLRVIGFGLGALLATTRGYSPSPGHYRGMLAPYC